MDLLRVEHVSKRYAGHTALDAVSRAVPQGSVYGLLGPNGAGKTTLIRIINRITAPDEGKVFFAGRELSAEDVCRIGYLPEERGLYKKMKVGEQALYFARLKGLSKKEATARLKEWFVKFGIRDWWDKKVEELSKGMAQKVQFIVTVLHRPPLLIFDEPFSGFDPINAELLKNEILALRDEGATIVFSTHNMSSVEEICDHITLINKSKNILSGSVSEIRRRHGENLFRVDFTGEPSALEHSPLWQRFGIEHENAGEERYRTVRLRLETPQEIREALGAINSLVDIRNFTEVIPDMNDIFIRAVNGRL